MKVKQKPRKPRAPIESRTTRRMVARMAGVSVATVSNALRNTPGKRIGQEARERIKRIAKELGYTPNFVGRALQTGRTFAIGVLQPVHESVFFQFYQSIIYGMVKGMAPDDYHLVVLFRSEEDAAMRVIAQGRVDGVFILQSDRNPRHIEQVRDTGIPAVVVNSLYENSAAAKTGCVCSDHETMMISVVREFQALGCKSIVQIHNPLELDPNFHMFTAFQAEAARLAPQGLVASSLTPNREMFPSQLEIAFAAGQRWDGVFVDGVEFAEQFVQVGRKFGMEPNRDYRLISSSNQAGECTPSRSEISAYTHQPEEVGKQAWDLMKQCIGGSASHRVIRVPYLRIPVAAPA